MPFKDPEVRRRYFRELMRRRRAEQGLTPKPKPVKPTAKDARIRKLEAELAQRDKTNPGQRFFPGIYAVQVRRCFMGGGTNLRAEPAFIEAVRWNRDMPAAGYVLRRGPKDYAVLSANSK